MDGSETEAAAASAPQSRREREKAAHREAILDAAEAVFAEAGYPGAAIAEIARRAEFSVGSIYNFFPGKRELAGAVMLRIATERVETVEREAMPLAADPRKGLPVFLRAWARHRARHGMFVRMGIEWQRSQGRMRPPENIVRLFESYRAAVERFFAAGVPSGLYRPLPPADLARASEGICRELSFEWERATPRRGEEELAERLLAVVPALLEN